MLVTKRFYCLFPLVYIVLHSMMMFSMVLTSPMENIGGDGHNPMDLFDWRPKRKGEDSGERYDDHASNEPNLVASSSHHPNKGGMGLEPIVNNAYQKKELEGLVQMIKYFRPIGSTSGKRRVVNTARKTFHDYGDRSQSILEELVDRSLPTSSLHKDVQGLKDMVPLMDVNDHLYFFARREDHLFYIFSRPDSKSPVQMYGHIKPGLTCEQILAWGKEKGFIHR